MSMDQTLIERSGYTVLDVLSDMGGLQGILVSGMSLILSILNHKFLDNYLISKLFQFEEIALKVSQTESIKEFCLEKCLPRKLVCCRSKKQK